jgi:hypothetical protein
MSNFKGDSTMNAQLRKAIAALAAVDRETADEQTVERDQMALNARGVERLATIRSNLALLASKREAKQKDLTAAEEAAVLAIIEKVSGRVLSHNSINAFLYRKEIAADLLLLRSAVPSGLNQPPGYKMSYLVEQAMKLQPELSDLDTPMFLIGAGVMGASDWPTRRRKIIEEHMANTSAASVAA